jgi:outer membrane protein
LNEEAVKINIRQSIEQAYTSLMAAAEQYTASKEALQSEARTFSDMENKFKVGLGSATDYLVEQSNYIKAQQNVVLAKYNYLLQVKQVDFYLGKSITF